ncbi:hypothetical protein AAG906_000381 [Vitis piasezkii]
MDIVPVESLSSKIISLFEKEASLLVGVRNELAEIQQELVRMKAFLVDIGRKGVGSEGEKAWVAIVRDIVYDVEGIIDEYIDSMNRPKEMETLQGVLIKVYLPMNLWTRHLWKNMFFYLRKREFCTAYDELQAIVDSRAWCLSIQKVFELEKDEGEGAPRINRETLQSSVLEHLGDKARASRDSSKWDSKVAELTAVTGNVPHVWWDS